MVTISKADRKLIGSISLTTSKSECNRALIIQALCKTPFTIHNIAKAKDTQTLISLLTSDDEILNVGPAGTTIRFLTAYFATKEDNRILTGTEHMKTRPIKILVEALKSLGADITYLENEGFPPIRIKGNPKLKSSVQIDGSISSQYITALLLIAPTLHNGLTITFKGKVASIPYINMTIRLMKYFGVKAIWKDQIITVAPQEYVAKDFTVEADWSAASYWYAMAALSDEVNLELKGLRNDSLQGDSVLAEIYEALGIRTSYTKDGVRLSKDVNQRLPELLKYDFSDCPDIAQTLATTCAALGIRGEFKGLESLRIKETDRISATRVELAKFGTPVEEIGNEGMRIEKGFDKTVCPTVKTYEDHRMAMAWAPLALKVPEVSFDDRNVVNKSYPDFWTDLEKVGFRVR